MGTHALARFRSLNSRWRSTNRSRTRGNLLIGSSVIGSSSLSTRAEHDWRVLPLISIVQAPQTSSRQPLSHTGVVVCFHSVVTGLAAMYWRQEMMFMFGRRGTANSSHRAVSGLSGPSCRRMRMITFRPAEAPAAAPLPSAPGAPRVVVPGWPLGADVASVTVGFIVPNRTDAAPPGQDAATFAFPATPAPRNHGEHGGHREHREKRRKRSAFHSASLIS